MRDLTLGVDVAGCQRSENGGYGQPWLPSAADVHGTRRTHGETIPVPGRGQAPATYTLILQGFKDRAVCFNDRMYVYRAETAKQAVQKIGAAPIAQALRAASPWQL